MSLSVVVFQLEFWTVYTGRNSLSTASTAFTF